MDILLFDKDPAARNYWQNLAQAHNLNFEVEESWKNAERLPQCPIIIADSSVSSSEFASHFASASRTRPHQVFVATGEGLKIAEVVHMMRSGIDFVFAKPLCGEEIEASIHELLECVSKKQAEKTNYEHLKQLFSNLTPKERNVLDSVLRGVPNKQTAEDLNVSVRTIEARRAKVYSKTKSNCVAELVRKVDLLNRLESTFEPPKDQFLPKAANSALGFAGLPGASAVCRPSTVWHSSETSSRLGLTSSWLR